MNISVDSSQPYIISFDNLKYGQFAGLEGYFETENAGIHSAFCEPLMYRGGVMVESYDHGLKTPIERERCYFIHKDRHYYRFSFIVPRGVSRIEIQIKCNDGTLRGYEVCGYVTDKIDRTKSNIKSVAHLGYTGYAPRNTISSFELAGLAGFRECVTNINYTSDGKLVALHNETIDESSNGSGDIRQMTYEEALKFDFGITYNPFYKGEKLPLIDEVIGVMAKHNMLPVLRLNGNTSTQKAETLCKILKKHGITDYTVKAFGENPLKNFYEVAGDNARYGFCVMRDFDDAFDFMKKFSAKDKYIDIFQNIVTPQEAKEILDAGFSLEAWIVNDFNTIINLSKMGVSGFTTDVFQFDNYIFSKNM